VPELLNISQCRRYLDAIHNGQQMQLKNDAYSTRIGMWADKDSFMEYINDD